MMSTTYIQMVGQNIPAVRTYTHQTHKITLGLRKLKRVEESLRGWLPEIMTTMVVSRTADKG